MRSRKHFHYMYKIGDQGEFKGSTVKITGTSNGNYHFTYIHGNTSDYFSRGYFEPHFKKEFIINHKFRLFDVCTHAQTGGTAKITNISQRKYHYDFIGVNGIFSKKELEFHVFERYYAKSEKKLPDKEEKVEKRKFKVGDEVVYCTSKSNYYMKIVSIDKNKYYYDTYKKSNLELYGGRNSTNFRHLDNKSYILYKPKSGENEIMKGLKNYMDKNQDTIYTILLVVLIDHFFLGGSLRGKIQGMCESVLNKQIGMVESDEK